MILFPLLGLAAGLAVGRRSAFVVTLVAAIAGFALLAALTEEIDGWYDPFVWIDALVGLLTTGLELGGGGPCVGGRGGPPPAEDLTSPRSPKPRDRPLTTSRFRRPDAGAKTSSTGAPSNLVQRARTSGAASTRVHRS